MDIHALTGAAYGTTLGGAIGGYASTVDFTGKKLNKKQRLALILAGSLAGASAGASIGATPMTEKRANTINKALRMLKHKLGVLRGRTLEAAKAEHAYRRNVRVGQKALEKHMDEILVDEPFFKVSRELGIEKIALTIDSERHKQLTNRIIKDSIDNNMLPENIERRVHRAGDAFLRTKEREAVHPSTYDLEKLMPIDNHTYKSMSGEIKPLPYANKGFRGKSMQIARAVKGAVKDPFTFGYFIKDHPATEMVNKGIEAAGSTYTGYKFLKKHLVKTPTPTLSKQIGAKLPSIGKGALLFGGTVGAVALGNKLTEKTAAPPKFNPSIIGESMDDVFDIYVMWKAQERMYNKDKANAKGQSPIKTN